jgi:hypothetical protein
MFGDQKVIQECVKEAILDVLYEYFPVDESLRSRHAAAYILKKLVKSGATIGFTFKEGM